ncbi:hypothetical protein NL676_016603 [Syzygium grande]|nr:hypothetical protein NL676_016603 [Syzygium grande]
MPQGLHPSSQVRAHLGEACDHGQRSVRACRALVQWPSRFGIRVNCLSPFGCATLLATKFVGLGPVEMEVLIGAMVNLKVVILKAEDVVNTALFLASDEGRYVSGHDLFIDGGLTVINPSFRMSRYPQEEA